MYLYTEYRDVHGEGGCTQNMGGCTQNMGECTRSTEMYKNVRGVQAYD